jgi:hypothetical protein
MSVLLIGNDRALYRYDQSAAGQTTWSFASMGGTWPATPVIGTAGGVGVSVLLVGHDFALDRFDGPAGPWSPSAGWSLPNMGGTWGKLRT